MSGATGLVCLQEIGSAVLFHGHHSVACNIASERAPDGVQFAVAGVADQGMLFESRDA